eukprot:3270282-Amphidinium_carterae.1
MNRGCQGRVLYGRPVRLPNFSLELVAFEELLYDSPLHASLLVQQTKNATAIALGCWNKTSIY